MKKSIFTIGLALVSALFLTTNCAKEEVGMVNGEESVSKAVPFKINVATQDTRTATEDGVTVNWEEGDAVNVFHAEAGSTTYGSNDKFTFTEGTSFNGELADGELDEGKTYDWYVLYPYESHIKTPANTSSGYLAICGSSKTASQKQEGNDSKAHLAGKFFPLYGKVTGVSATATPTVTLEQALAVVKVSVKNGTDNALTVTNVSFTATEDIVGSYYIDFSGDTPVFTPNGTNVANTAKLTVSEGDEIAKDESAAFYIAVKPFTATGTLTVSVNGFEKEYDVTGVEFKPGKIKTVNFNWDKPEVEYDELTYVWTDLSGNGYQNWTKEGSYSDAVYSGNTNANTDYVIQLRGTDNAGIVSTTSGGALKKVAVIWSSKTTDASRAITIYGKNTPYNGTADLYSDDAKGTVIGTLGLGDEELEVEDYYEYVGILANGPLYLDEIDIAWGTPKTKIDAPTKVAATPTGGTINVTWTDVPSGVSKYIVTCTGQTTQEVNQGVQTASFTNLMNGKYDVTVQAVPTDTDTYSYSKIVTVSNVTVTDGLDEPVYVLDGTVAEGDNGYASESVITQDGVTWMVTGNTTISPWRIGGKNLAGVDRTLYSTTSIEDNVSKIEITHGSANNITVNSMTVIVASNDSFSSIVSTLTPTFAANSTVTVEKPAGANWTGCYYKIVYNVTVSGGSNSFIQFTKAEFYK